MNKDHAQTFWVVCFKALDHEFDGAVILNLSVELLSSESIMANHVRHRKASHVEDNRLPSVSGGSPKFCGRNLQQCQHATQVTNERFQ